MSHKDLRRNSTGGPAGCFHKTFPANDFGQAQRKIPQMYGYKR
jgi:hypothetical protein